MSGISSIKGLIIFRRIKSVSDVKKTLKLGDIRLRADWMLPVQLAKSLKY